MYDSRTPAVKAMQQALVLAKQRKYAEAIPFYQEALALGMVGMWGAFGFALFQCRRYAEALSAYERAIALEPGTLRRGETAIHVNRVVTMIELKRFDAALAATDEMLSQARRNCDVWVCRGLVFAALKRYNDAEEALLMAVELAPTSRFALLQLSNFYRWNIRNFNQAMEICERLLVQRPHDEAVWELNGMILHDSRGYQEAVDAYERALECKLESPVTRAQSWSNYGISLLCLGRIREALAAFDHSEAFAPARMPLLNGRGAIHSRIEQQGKALEWYEAAIHADPDAIMPRLNKAESLAYLGRYDEAEPIVIEALAAEPESFGAWSVKGLLETRLGHHDAAMAAFSKSIELEPKHGPAYMELALLLLDLDDAEHACKVAERATALDPYYTRAWKVKGQALRAAGREEEAVVAERRGAELLAEQTAQVDAYLREKGQTDAPHE